MHTTIFPSYGIILGSVAAEIAIGRTYRRAVYKTIEKLKIQASVEHKYPGRVRKSANTVGSMYSEYSVKKKDLSTIRKPPTAIKFLL